MHCFLGHLIWRYKKYEIITNIINQFMSIFVHIFLHIGRLARMSVLDTEVDGSNPGSSMLFP